VQAQQTMLYGFRKSQVYLENKSTVKPELLITRNKLALGLSSIYCRGSTPAECAHNIITTYMQPTTNQVIK